MIKNADFNGSVDTNPYKFRHYDNIELSLHVNGKRSPSVGFTVFIDHEKMSVMAIGHSFKGSAYITRTRDYR